MPSSKELDKNGKGGKEKLMSHEDESTSNLKEVKINGSEPKTIKVGGS